MSQKEMTSTGQGKTPVRREREHLQKNYLRPAVDILESDQSLILAADMPGVDKEHLDVNLERGVLTIKGELRATEQGEPLFREFAVVGTYYRQFELSDTFDSEKTTAEFKGGVLTLTLAKSEATKPRRIEIRH